MSQAAARGPEDSPHSDRSIPAPLVSRSAGYSQFSRADAPRTPREAPTPTVFLRAWSGWSRHQPPAVAKPDQSPSACPPGSARWRKDRNLGYEHRWTPNTAGPGGVNHDRAGGVYHPMSKLPRDALEQHRAASHVEPAGLQSRRVVSPLGLRMDFGTAYGRLAPEPQAQEVRNLPASGVGVDVSEFPGPVRSASTCSEQPGSECLAAPGGDDVAADIGFVQKPTSPADVTTLRLDESHTFLVLASDGVWGVLDQLAEGSAARSRGVAWRVAAARAAGKSAGDIADGLVRCAAREGGTDNASCIVLLLGSGT